MAHGVKDGAHGLGHHIAFLVWLYEIDSESGHSSVKGGQTPGEIRRAQRNFPNAREIGVAQGARVINERIDD